MNAEQFPTERIFTVVHQSPTAFERLALDALGASGEVQGQLTPIDLPQGRTDGGYDGWLRGRFRGLVGEIRVSVKASGEWEGLRAQHKKDLERHHGAPVLLICALRLNKDQRERLGALAQQHSVPAQEVVDLGELAAWLRGPALAVALAWLAEPPGPLVSLRYALERRLIADPAGPTPTLGCEAAAAAALLEAGDAPGGGIVSLRVRPHLDRPQRVIGALAHQIEAKGAPRQWWWVRASPAGGDDLRLAAGRVPQGAPAPAFLLDLSDGVPPSAAADLVKGCPDVRLFLIGSEAQLREAVGAAAHLRKGPPPVELALAQPTMPEMRAWWAEAAPDLREVRRQHLGDLCQRDPGPAERLLSDSKSLQQGVVEALELAHAHQLTDRHISALGWVALRGRWSSPPEAEWTGWLEARTGLSAREQDDALTAAIAAGLLHQPRPDSMVVPRTEALRLGLIWAGHLKAHGPTHERLAAAVLAAPEPEQADLLGAALDHFHHSELDPHLRAPLRGSDRLLWASWLSQRPCETPEITRIVLEELHMALQQHTDNAALRQLVAQAAAATIGDAVLDGLPLLVATADALVQYGRPRPFKEAVGPMLHPNRLRGATAAALADLMVGHVERPGADAARWQTAARELIRHWLGAGVARSEAARSLYSFRTRPWNPEAAAVAEAWDRVAELCVALVRAAPAEGWAAVRSLGAAQWGEAPALPPQLVTTLSALLRSLVGELPPINPPEHRVVAEDALLVAALQGWCEDGLAAEVVAAHSADPRLLAWRCAMDPMRVVLDPTEAAAHIRAMGGAAWWRAHVTANRDVYREALPGLVDALVALQLDDPGAAALLRALPVDSHTAGTVLVAAWAAAQPGPFITMLEAPLWSSLPRPAQLRLLQAARALPDRRLGLAVRAAALTALDRAENTGGLCAELRALLDTPEQVEDGTAEVLIAALEQALPPARVATTLQRLAAHPGTATRHQLSCWASGAALRGVISSGELGAFFERLTAGDLGLDGADTLLWLLRAEDEPGSSAGQVLEEVLLRRLMAWIERPAPLHALGLRPTELGGPFTRLMREAPVVWWRWATLLTMPAAPASWLVEEADSAAIEAALDAAPVELARFSSTSQAYDMLARALSAERFNARGDAALAAGAVAEARRLLLGRGLSVDLIPLFERVILATAEAGAEPSLDWGRRVVGREGQTGYPSTGMIGLAADQEQSDLSPEQLDPVGAAIRARLTERSTTAPSRPVRSFYQQLLREMNR